MRPEKRVDLFIEAAGAARREEPGIRACVAGEGRERQRLEGPARAGGVELLGARHDVLELIAAAGAVCLPSEAEAMPMSLLEAMALGRPVVAADVGGNAELVADGETGFLVPPGDLRALTGAILELARDPARATAMGAAAARASVSASRASRWWTATSAHWRGRSSVARPDVVLISLGTTLGWRVSDRMLVEQLRRAGASAEAVSIGRGAADRLRRGYPVNDLVEMYAARRTVRSAVERLEPRALIVSSTTAAMLLPRCRSRTRSASTPPPGSTGRARASVPARARAARHAPRPRDGSAERRGRGGAPEGAARPIVVSAPIDPSSDSPPDEREPLAVAYVPDPKAKGLEIVVGAWAGAAVEGARLAVYGLDPEWALAHLRRTGTPRPDSLELPGMVPAAEFRAALRRARAFVHGARWEDWGQAPLEALADGALLASVPAGGP